MATDVSAHAQLRAKRSLGSYAMPLMAALLLAALIVWLAINFDKGPAYFFTISFIGLTNGAVYALIALGYTLVYGILELINFAHGDVFMLGGMFSATMILSVFNLTKQSSTESLAVAIVVSLVVAMVACGAINATIERVAYRPLRNAPRLAPLITAIGVSFILEDIAIAWKGPSYIAVPQVLPTNNVFSIGGVQYTWEKFIVVLITVPVLLALIWLVKRTRQGKAMRATAQDRDAAAMMGINVNRTISFTFLIAGALAGAAGLLYALYFGQVRYDTGFQLGLIAFTAAVLGGIGNLPGAVLGAMCIGFIQAFNEGLQWHAPGSDWTQSIVFGILILILVFRPEGLLGERTPEGDLTMRRRIAERVSHALWSALAAVGFPRERWLGLPRLTRRTVKAVLWLVVALVLIRAFGVWKTSALAAAVVVLLLAVPWYEKLTFRGKRIGKWVVPAAVLAIAIAYPYYGADMPEVPIFGPFPQLSTMVVMMIFTIMALGLNFVVGYAGLLDLGYVAFYAMGAYMAGWFASNQFAKQNLDIGAVGLYKGDTGFHFSMWLVLPMAGIATAAIGILIGLPTLRLRGDYLAIVTLGFGEIVQQIARNGDSLFGTGFNLTNGTGGITPIDGPGFGNWAHHYLHLPAQFVSVGNFDAVFLWTALALVVLTAFVSARLRDSRIGRAWIAIREDETAAAAMGVPLMRTKTWSYATGAFFGGVAGAFYASYKSGAFPDDFFFQISVFILCMVILGGMGNIWGVIFGACFLSYLDREGLSNVGTWINGHFHTHLDVPLYEFGIFGAIIVIVMLFRPEGLIPSSRVAAEMHEGVHDEPLYDLEIAGD